MAAIHLVEACYWQVGRYPIAAMGRSYESSFR